MNATALHIPKGYKRTEVGVIPSEWTVESLTNLAERIMVGIASAATHAYRQRGVVMFRNQNIKPGQLDDSDILFIAEDYEMAFRNKRLKAGDLLTARTGYPGTTSIVPNHYDGAQSFTTLITRPLKNKVNPEYLCCYINSEAGQAFFQANQIGGGQKNVNAGTLKTLPVPLPSTLAEQQAIAEALGDADAQIESLEQLVAKKRVLKKAAMQELLTGTRRLPGYETKSGHKQTDVGLIPEDWEFTSLRDVVTFLDGKRRPVKDSDRAKMRGTIPYYGASGIVDYVNDYLFDEELILLGEDGENILSRNVPLAFRISGRAWVNNHAHVLRPNHPQSIGFLTEFLESMNYEQYNSGTAQPKLNKQTCNRIPIAWPPLAEQEAIAKILCAMDEDIAATEAKLEKARQIKQGMMQELLTGRIRLV